MFMHHMIEDVVQRAQMVSIIQHNRKGTIMLYAIAVVLVVLWLLGMVSSYTMGGFIHVLLVIAVIAILYRIISGRKVA